MNRIPEISARWQTKLLFILPLFFALAGEARAAVYYISPSGASGDACTQANPCNFASAHAKNDVTEIIAGGGIYHDIWRITKNNLTVKNKIGETPIIDGEFIRPFSGVLGTTYSTNPTYADMGNDCLLDIRGDGVVVDGIRVFRSSATGIRIYNSDRVKNVTLKNCQSDWAYGVAVQVYYADDILIEGCEFSRGAYLVPTYCSGNWGCCDSVAPCRRLDPANTITRQSNRVTWRRNIIRDSWHEGFLFDENANDNIVEYNKIYGNFKYQLYFANNFRNTIRGNLIYGTNSNINDRTGVGSGILLNAENIGFVSGAYGPYNIYGNMVANTNVNLGIAVYCPDPSSDSASACYNANQTLVANIYNNTFINPRTDSNVILGPGKDSAPLSNTINFRNNVILGAVSGFGIANGISNLTTDYNLWSIQPAAAYRGAHDPAYAVPLLVKTTGWNSLSGGSLSFNDFKLQAGSPGINAGTALGSPYNIDYFGTTRPQGSAWDIGAHEYLVSGGDTTAPAVPSGLSVR